MLRILDKESANLAKRTLMKKKRAVDTAQKRMGATKNQPGILDAISKRSTTLEQGLTCGGRSGWKSSQGAAASGVSGGVLQPVPGEESQTLPLTSHLWREAGASTR